VRNHLTAAIVATMSLTALDAAAAPSSMMHTLPCAPQQSQSQAAPAEKGPLSWATKWFRGEPVDPVSPPDVSQAPIMAYQPPTTAAPFARPAVAVATPVASHSGATMSAPAAPQQVAMNNAWHGFGGMPTAAVSTPSDTTPIHQAPRTSIAQVTPSLGGPISAGASTPADEARSLREQGHAKDRAGDLAAAEVLYRQSLAADPTSAASVNDLGLCLARQGKLEQSAAVLRQAIMMRPDKQLYRNNIATVLVELGKTDEALSHLQTVSSPAAAHYNVGQLLVRGGKTDEAKTQFAKAIQIDPSLGAAREALVKLDTPTPQALVNQQPKREPTRPEPIAVAQAAPAFPQLPQQSPVSDITPLEPAPADDADAPLSGPPSFPRLLPPVLSR
jgi:TolA-binding protein